MDQNAFETGARQCVAITASPEINSLETAVASEIRTADVDDSLDGRLFIDLTNLVRQIYGCIGTMNTNERTYMN